MIITRFTKRLWWKDDSLQEAISELEEKWFVRFTFTNWESKKVDSVIKKVKWKWTHDYYYQFSIGPTMLKQSSLKQVSRVGIEKKINWELRALWFKDPTNLIEEWIIKDSLEFKRFTTIDIKRSNEVEWQYNHPTILRFIWDWKRHSVSIEKSIVVTSSYQVSHKDVNWKEYCSILTEDITWHILGVMKRLWFKE